MTLWVNGGGVEDPESASRTRIRSGILPYFYLPFLCVKTSITPCFFLTVRAGYVRLFSLFVYPLFYTRSLFGRVPLSLAHPLFLAYFLFTLSCSHSLLGRVPTTPLHAEIYIFANHTNAFFLWGRTFRAKVVKTKAV